MVVMASDHGRAQAVTIVLGTVLACKDAGLSPILAVAITAAIVLGAIRRMVPAFKRCRSGSTG